MTEEELKEALHRIDAINYSPLTRAIENNIDKIAEGDLKEQLKELKKDLEGLKHPMPKDEEYQNLLTQAEKLTDDKEAEPGSLLSKCTEKGLESLQEKYNEIEESFFKITGKIKRMERESTADGTKESFFSRMIKMRGQSSVRTDQSKETHQPAATVGIHHPRTTTRTRLPRRGRE